MRRLEAYDLQITFTLNPLNWQVRAERYHTWGLQIEFGPLSVLALRPLR